MLHYTIIYLARFQESIDPLPKTPADSVTFKLIMNIVFVILGTVAVLVIVIAGLNFTLSQGDANKISRARNAIIYALGGLLIILFAAAIVNFVLSR